MENLKKISARLCKCNKKHAQNVSFQTCFLLKLAERKGFEPLCGLTRKLISSQPRYDHFDTSPYMHREYVQFRCDLSIIPQYYFKCNSLYEKDYNKFSAHAQYINDLTNSKPPHLVRGLYGHFYLCHRAF